VTSNVKGQIVQKFSKSKNLRNFDLLGALEIKKKVAIFTANGHIVAWMHVVWAILRQNWLGVWPPGEPEKVRKSRTPIGMVCRR